MNPSSVDAPGLVIVCVGRTSRSEFRDVLPTLAPWGTVITAPHLRAARAQLTRDSLTPDVIVFVQSYPGEFTDEQVDDLRRDAPLARLVAILGTWCEGEMRSGTPWSGAVRVYWHQWKPHCHLEMEHMLAGRESQWSLPPTACEEERCLAIAARTHEQGAERRGGEYCQHRTKRPARPLSLASGTGNLAIVSKHCFVDIVTEQYDVFDLLAAACHDRGYKPRWRRTHNEPHADSPAVILFDAAGEMADEQAKFRRLQVERDAVSIVLADFPRIADCNRFVCAGAEGVLSRPFYWDDLFWYFPANPLSHR